MDGEQKFVLLVIGVIAVCLTILYSLLFIALWPYRGLVGLSLLAVFILLVLVYLRGKLNEQALRHVRYHYREEIPLDEQGEPRYLPDDAQVNRHRFAHHSPSSSGMSSPKASYMPYESGYQSYGGED
jgi:hypothetical protein